MSKIIDEIPLIAFDLHHKSDVPLYNQLYNLFRDAILSGKIKRGKRLPGTRSLANDLKISRNTVATAFDQLRIEGYISGKTGSGYYVNEIPDKRVVIPVKSSSKLSTLKKVRLRKRVPLKFRQSSFSAERILPFQNGVPALNEFPIRIWSKLFNQISFNFSNLHLGYSDAAGFRPLREIIASYLQTYRAVNCSADQILIINGSQQGLDIITRILLKKGSNIWMEDPGYSGVKASMIAAEVKLLPCPLDEEGIDMKYSKKHNAKPDLIYTTPSHQFPTGVIMPISRRLELLKFAAENKCWIIEDDYDSEFRYIGHPLASLQGMDENKSVFYLGTFSKVLIPGLRLGYLVLPDSSMMESFKSLKYIMDRQSPVFEQMILARYIEEGHFTKHIRRMRMLYKSRQEFIVNEINKNFYGLLTSDFLPSGMHIVAKLRSKMNDRKVAAEALKHNVIVHPISDYCLKFKQAPALIMGYTAFTENEIREGLNKLKEVLTTFI